MADQSRWHYRHLPYIPFSAFNRRNSTGKVNIKPQLIKSPVVDSPAIHTFTPPSRQRLLQSWAKMHLKLAVLPGLVFVIAVLLMLPLPLRQDQEVVPKPEPEVEQAEVPDPPSTRWSTRARSRLVVDVNTN
ncbi:hypothetical protein FB451DRAFT_1415343 [Mycena latifolia]|nr:hypothetical protein FB451DRAFT_1415343 [Mycena latifolia]